MRAQLRHRSARPFAAAIRCGSLPTPFGHEFSGVVVEVGEGVTGFKVGDELMAAPTAPCGICFYCQRGQENLCRAGDGQDGAGRVCGLPAAAGARRRAQRVSQARRRSPFEEAALLEPLSCVVHAQEMARPRASRERADRRRGSRSACCTCWRCKRARGARGRGRGTRRGAPEVGGASWAPIA